MPASVERREAVRAIPAPVRVSRRRRRDPDTGREPGEPAGPVRERAQPQAGRPVERAAPDRPVPIAGVEDPEARAGDRTELARLTFVFRALFRDVQGLASLE